MKSEEIISSHNIKFTIMRAITRITISVLSGLLVLLGFNGCKSARKAVKEKDGTVISDTIQVIEKKTMPKDDPTRIRVVYGPAPARYNQNIK